MPFPISPLNGQVALVNNINYQWDNTNRVWNRQTAGGPITSNTNVVTTSLLPAANVTYDLGSPTQRFRSLYLSGNTIDLGGATIKTDATTGAVAIVPQVTVANPNPTGVVFTATGAVSTVVTTGGVVSADAVATASNNTSTASSFATQARSVGHNLVFGG
jgi:hypothetical protein